MIKLCCNGCGSDLQVGDDVRFLTCNYCHSKLEVVRDVTATHTRVLEKLERATDRIAGNLKVIELQNDLERVDREWEARRQSLLVRGQNGGLYEPSAIGSVIGSLAAILGGIVLALFLSNNTVGYFPLFGLLFSCIGFMNLVSGLSKSSAFRDGRSRHRQQREQLIGEIERERRR
ncbi:hypothetical protein [Luteolibacter sp. LG18]|uniref:hypothetical protein n=1 Tax=Luteolibacter sp. LG18 TaxID=2819286 RepID=UPI0030C6FDB5